MFPPPNVWHEYQDRIERVFLLHLSQKYVPTPQMFGTNMRIELKVLGFIHILEIYVYRQQLFFCPTVQRQTMMGLRVSALFNGVPLKECTQCIAMFTLGTAKKNTFLPWYFAILVYHTGDHKHMCENLKNYEFESIFLILAVGNSWG